MTDATPDFEAMTRAELVELRGKIDRAIAAAGERDRQRALKAAEDLAREHGFSLAELVGSGTGKGRGAGKRGGRTAAASPALSDVKYRNPDNLDQTWSGRRPAASLVQRGPGPGTLGRGAEGELSQGRPALLTLRSQPTVRPAELAKGRLLRLTWNRRRIPVP